MTGKINKSGEPQKARASIETLKQWFNGDGADARELLSAPYRVAKVHAGADLYLDKLYKEKYLTTPFETPYRLPALVEDDLVSALQIKAEKERLRIMTAARKQHLGK